MRKSDRVRAHPDLLNQSQPWRAVHVGCTKRLQHVQQHIRIFEFSTQAILVGGKNNREFGNLPADKPIEAVERNCIRRVVKDRFHSLTRCSF